MMKSFHLVFAFSFILMVSGQGFSEDITETNLDEPYYEQETAFIRSGLVEYPDGTLTKFSSISYPDHEVTHTNGKLTPNKKLIDEKTANDAFRKDDLKFKEDVDLENSTFNTSSVNSLLSDFREPLENTQMKMKFRGIVPLENDETLPIASSVNPEPASFPSPGRVVLTIKRHKSVDLSKTSDSDFMPQHKNESLTTETYSNEHFFEDFSTFFSDTQLPNRGNVPILNRKVFKGRRVAIGEHPYIVSIRRNYSHYLTGSLLRKNIVITVAHPVYHVPIYELGVVTGESYNDRGTSIIMVLLVIIHPKYDRYTLHNDLALLMTYGEGNIRYNVRHIKGICSNSVILDKKVAFVTGWGRCDLNGEEMCLPRSSVYYPDEVSDPMLRSISFTINIREDDEAVKCVDYHKLGLRPHGRTICVGNSRVSDFMAPCLGVPGAPLVVQGNLVGVLSWGFGCGYTKDLPLVYTDTRKYRGWIESNVRIWDTLGRSNMTQLFSATKAYLLSELTFETRDVKPEKQLGFYRQIELNSLDYTLAKLKGKLYDIRDFIDGGKYHSSKKVLYRNLRMKLIVQNMDNNMTTTNPPYGTDDSESSAVEDPEARLAYEYKDNAQQFNEFSDDD